MREALFRLTDIRYAYEPGRSVLQGVDFELFPGERVALTGPNGGGKTTLLHIMVGLHKADAGQVHAFGKLRRDERDYQEVRTRAGLLFQDPDDQLFCPTVAEDVAFGPFNLGKRREEVRSLVQQTLDSLDLGTFADRITYKLSGGEKRLVSLATVLAMQPEVLLLDEPSNALDEPAQEKLVRILQQLPQSMIIISHDRDFLAQLATRTLRMEQGRLMRH